jgi:hypothetical protein
VEAQTWVLIVLGGLLVFSSTRGFVFSIVIVFSSRELHRCPRCCRFPTNGQGVQEVSSRVGTGMAIPGGSSDFTVETIPR